MRTDDAFLAAIRESPGDDTPRVEYADWLEERGEDAKAAYLRAVVDAVAEFREDRPSLAAVRLGTLAPTVPAEWVEAVGRRFAVVLFGYAAERKLVAIKCIREATGCGLAEGKEISESLPARIVGPVSHHNAEHAFVILRREPSNVVLIRPDGDPVTLDGHRFRVVAWAHDWHPRDERATDAVGSALRQVVSACLGLDGEAADRKIAVSQRESLTCHRVVLAEGLDGGRAYDLLRTYRARVPEWTRRRPVPIWVAVEPDPS